MSQSDKIRIGCAGWSVPEDHALFDQPGSHLERYARCFNAVEINTCFYRSHRPETYSRWAASVPDDFLFAVKMPKEITHDRRLVGVDEALGGFLSEVSSLGHKLGPVLIQLPPSLALDCDVTSRFFEQLRWNYGGLAVCEPRHQSWFADPASRLLESFRIGRVAADPVIEPVAAEPGGSMQVVYHRLHGSPRMYYSSYEEEYLESLCNRLQQNTASETKWCIFDNTAAGAAVENALSLIEKFKTAPLDDLPEVWR